MIEDLTIITGPQDEVQSEAREFLAAHPNARVLATAITFKPGPLLELPPVNATDVAAAKDKDTTSAAGDTTGAAGDTTGATAGKAGAGTGTTTTKKAAANAAAPDAEVKEDAPPDVATALLAEVQHGPGEIIVSLTLGNVFP